MNWVAINDDVAAVEIAAAECEKVETAIGLVDFDSLIDASNPLETAAVAGATAK